MPKARRKRRIALWTLLALFMGAILWSAVSNNPFAQVIQEVAGRKHDQTILDKTFSVSPHSFRYYKFTLPADSSKMAIEGQFSATREPANGTGGADSSEGNIEVYVLSESAFAPWSRGQSAASIFASGQAPKGTIQADLPDGPGDYYLVFSDKFSSGAKNVKANAALHTKAWTDWFRSKAR